MRWMFVFSVCLSSSLGINIPKPGEVLNKIPKPDEVFSKLFFRPQESVSKFPPFLEFFLQKVQSHYSTYVHEDLSRPPTWDKPVYTLSPADQLFFSVPSPTSEATASISVEEEHNLNMAEEDSTEKLTEIITHTGDVPTANSEDIPQKLFEIINSVTEKEKDSFIYITPKTSSSVPYTTQSFQQSTEKFFDPDLELNISLKKTSREVPNKIRQ